MLIHFLYGVISLFLILFSYIKIKYRFWSTQPVFHIYNIWYLLFPPGIIQHSIPPPTKFYDHSVHTTKFESLSTKKKALMCNLIQAHYLYDTKAKYTPKHRHILEYFTYNKPSAIISLYTDPICKDTVACITGRDLYGQVHGNPITVHYVDFLCVKKKHRKKGIAPKLIYSHYLNSRRLNSSAICMFKREGNVNLIVPITIYKTYAISDKKWLYPNMDLPNNISCHIVGTQNYQLLIDFIGEINTMFKCFIIPKREVWANLIENSLIIPCLICDNSLPIGVIFYRYPHTSYNKEKSIECIASYCKKGYEEIFKESFTNTIVLLKKRYTFSIILIENISHNYLLIEKAFSRSTPKWVCTMAFYFYNFAYRPFLSSNVFIIA